MLTPALVCNLLSGAYNEREANGVQPSVSAVADRSSRCGLARRKVDAGATWRRTPGQVQSRSSIMSNRRLPELQTAAVLDARRRVEKVRASSRHVRKMNEADWLAK